MDAVWDGISRIGPGMRQIVGFGDWSMGGGNFGGECWAPHCNQWGVRRGLFFGQSYYGHHAFHVALIHKRAPRD